MAIPQEKFEKILTDLSENSDFTDPFWIEKDGFFLKFTEDKMGLYYADQFADTDVTLDEIWEVINFVQESGIHEQVARGKKPLTALFEAYKVQTSGN